MSVETASAVTAEEPTGVAFVDWGYISARLPVSRTTAWRWMRAGRFPRSRRLGPGRVAWVKGEVDAWLATAAGR